MVTISQEHRLDTAKILVENGADVHKKSKYGDDALQTASVKVRSNTKYWDLNTAVSLVLGSEYCSPIGPGI